MSTNGGGKGTVDYSLVHSDAKEKIEAMYYPVTTDDIQGRQEYVSKDRSITFKRLHWGQRKLLLALLQFLTLAYNEYKSLEGATVLYIGAASGHNIAFIADMFPEVEFHLYDPAQFDDSLRSRGNVHLYNEYFLDETSETWASFEGRLLLVSDIRTAPDEQDTGETAPSRGGRKDGRGGHYAPNKGRRAAPSSQDALRARNDHVEENMRLQERITLAVKPAAYSLKFRLPWEYSKGDVYKYLPGKIYIQAYPPPNSTETRLVNFVKQWGDNDGKFDVHEYDGKLAFHNDVERGKYYTKAATTSRKIKGGGEGTVTAAKYDPADYEAAMAFHNMVGRSQYYAGFAREEDEDVAATYCHCYDCFHEYNILTDYIVCGHRVTEEDQVLAVVKLLSYRISKYLNLEKATELHVGWTRPPQQK